MGPPASCAVKPRARGGFSLPASSSGATLAGSGCSCPAGNRPRWSQARDTERDPPGFPRCVWPWVGLARTPASSSPAPPFLGGNSACAPREPARREKPRPQGLRPSGLPGGGSTGGLGSGSAGSRCGLGAGPEGAEWKGRGRLRPRTSSAIQSGTRRQRPDGPLEGARRGAPGWDDRGALPSRRVPATLAPRREEGRSSGRRALVPCTTRRGPPQPFFYR